MKKFILSIILGMSLALGACSQKDFLVHDPATLVTPQQKIQAAIDQAKLVTVSVIRTAVSNREAGMYTDDEWFNIKETINDATTYLDRAQEALNIGDEVVSQGQLALADSALNYLRAELIKRKNEGQ